ncbi:MAG: hypothetical protein IJR99_01085 [Kiritimatiellae bacterium]|nr:hypothetical protein [Kiritimatiellia bacterium]
MKQQLVEYVSKTLDRAFSVEAFRPDLPLHMLRYDFCRGRLLGRDLVFAVVRDDVQNAGEYGQMAKLLKDEFSCPVVFVFRSLATAKRNSLIAHGVAFVVPRWQLFLPPNLHLNEKAPMEAEVRKVMRPATQALVIRQIERGDIEGKTAGDLSPMLGYTKMTLSNITSELVALGLAELDGWPRKVSFKIKGRKLWDAALPHFASPVKMTIPNKLKPSRLCLAGISALSKYTMISPDSVPVYACTLKESKDVGICQRIAYEGDARSRLQVWRYDPHICGKDKVDRLSLYLSLRDCGDPRVASELDALLEGMSW